mmetsp:Transcript_41504/g.96895  ORF Transcript_41504/g.96895 Transcript_41504/m.96895 type:complete len:164 (-) Transcript_41504:31-522(-)
MCDLIVDDTKAGVPDHPSVGRWCKGCQTFLPIDSFPPGRRRFKCKKHCRPSIRASSKDSLRERMQRMTPEKKALWRMWHYAYTDSKALFCIDRGEKPSLKQADIKAACEELGVEASEQLRVVPVCPSKPVGAASENSYVCSHKVISARRNKGVKIRFLKPSLQ